MGRDSFDGSCFDGLDPLLLQALLRHPVGRELLRRRAQTATEIERAEAREARLRAEMERERQEMNLAERRARVFLVYSTPFMVVAALLLAPPLAIVPSGIGSICVYRLAR